jgi:hypothetical protein
MRIPFAVSFSFLTITALGQMIITRAADGSTDQLNEPFSADAVTAMVRTLPDGTHIRRETTVKMYRDSAGRSRTDRSPGQFMANQPKPPVVVSITDPIAGYSYALDSANKIAHRSPLKSSRPNMRVGSPPPAVPAQAPVANTPKPQFKTEDLGTQTMEGLMVQGRRITVTYPAGSMGNDRDITNVSEMWTSQELHLMMLQVHSDPRSGETTTKIENLSRTQPDPDLFLPPPDYKVVDATTVQ